MPLPLFLSSNFGSLKSYVNLKYEKSFKFSRAANIMVAYDTVISLERNLSNTPRKETHFLECVFVSYTKLGFTVLSAPYTQ